MYKYKYTLLPLLCAQKGARRAPLKKLQNDAKRPKGLLLRPLLTSGSLAAAC